LPQPTKYANVAAKIGAERGKLLTETKLKALSEDKDLNEFAAHLRETSYQEKLAKTTLPYNGRNLERVFQETLIDTYIKTVKNSPPRVLAYLNMYLQRFEAENIKALVKATNAELETDQKLSQIYLSAEDYFKRRTVFEEAVKALELKQLVAALKKVEYAAALHQGLKSFEENAATTCFDALIDKVYYEKQYTAFQSLSKKEKPHAYFYATTENTSYILLTLLRGKTFNYDPNWLRIIIPDVHFLSKETIESLVTASDFEAALSLIQRTPYGGFFAKASTPEETVATADRAFKKALYVHALESRIPEAFNIGLPLAFMYQKETEAHNLICISLGIEAEQKPEEITNTLLF
jgi:vacuolar-type H+-ATPase subunit C/Vma6